MVAIDANITCYQLILGSICQASRKNGEYWVRSLLKCLNRRDVGPDCHYNLVMARHCVGTFLTVLVRDPRPKHVRAVLVQDCFHPRSVYPPRRAPMISHAVTQSPQYTFAKKNPRTLNTHNLRHLSTRCTEA